EVRCPNQQLPKPLVAWQFRKILGRLTAPLSFQLADRVVLPASELPRHFNREGHAVERANAGGEPFTAGSTLTGDSQEGGRLELHQCGFSGRGVFGLVEFI